MSVMWMSLSLFFKHILYVRLPEVRAWRSADLRWNNK